MTMPTAVFAMRRPHLSRIARLDEALMRLIERFSRARKLRATRQLESRLTNDVAKAFRAQGRNVMAVFEELKPRLSEAFIAREALTESDWIALFAAIDANADDFIVPIEAAVAAAMVEGAAIAIADFALDISFDLRNPRAVAYLRDYGAQRVTQVNQTTKDAIRDMIVRGIEERRTYDQIAKDISARFAEFAVGKPQQHIDSRAHLVAVTEIGNGYEHGSEIVVKDLQAGGLVMEKYWLTSHDDRVSDGCRANENDGWIPLDQAHNSGHMKPLRFPGCRCTELYRRKGSEG